MSKVIGTMVFCLTCRTVVWAHDGDLGDVRGILNMMKIPCRLCGEKGNYDGFHPTSRTMEEINATAMTFTGEALLAFDGWSTMRAIAKDNNLEWDISPDLSWEIKEEVTTGYTDDF